MPELKKFPVFTESGRIGTLTAAARFLDSRSEKKIQLDDGREISVASDALTVRSDGSFFLRDSSALSTPAELPSQPAAPHPASNEVNGTAASSNRVDARAERPDARMFRDGYAIEHVQIDRIVAEAPPQRQEGDTLILPVVEEVLVMEKRLMLREEIRITRRRETVEEVHRIDSLV